MVARLRWRRWLRAGNSFANVIFRCRQTSFSQEKPSKYWKCSFGKLCQRVFVVRHERFEHQTHIDRIGVKENPFLKKAHLRWRRPGDSVAFVKWWRRNNKNSHTKLYDDLMIETYSWVSRVWVYACAVCAHWMADYFFHVKTKQTEVSDLVRKSDKKATTNIAELTRQKKWKSRATKKRERLITNISSVNFH